MAPDSGAFIEVTSHMIKFLNNADSTIVTVVYVVLMSFFVCDGPTERAVLASYTMFVAVRLHDLEAVRKSQSNLTSIFKNSLQIWHNQSNWSLCLHFD